MADVPIIRVTFSGSARSAGDASVPLVSARAIGTSKASDALKKHVENQSAFQRRSAPEMSAERKAAFRAQVESEQAKHRGLRQATSALNTSLTAARGNTLDASRSVGSAGMNAVMNRLSPEARLSVTSAIAKGTMAGFAAKAAIEFLGSSSYASLMGYLGAPAGATESVRQFFEGLFLPGMSIFDTQGKVAMAEEVMNITGNKEKRQGPFGVFPSQRELMMLNEMAAVKAGEQKVINRLAADISHAAGRAAGFASIGDLRRSMFGSGINRFLRGIGGG